MLLTARQESVASKGVAAANDALSIIEPLERFAAMVPEYAERVAQVRTKRDFLLHLSESLLTVNSMSKG